MRVNQVGILVIRSQENIYITTFLHYKHILHKISFDPLISSTLFSFFPCNCDLNREWSVAEAWRSRRRRRHRVDHLNEIEEQLAKQRHQRTETNDIALWKGKNDVFTDKFSTKNTWNQIRNISPVVPWHKGVWFAYAIPKHSFCAWLAVQGKLSTGDRMMKWNGNVSGNCVLCANNIETRDHLFFSCSYVTEIWSALAKGLLKTRFTSSWSQLLKLASDNSQDRVEGLLLRYIFQATIYTVWRERNGRRHGETPNTSTNIIGWIDKQIRNQLTTIRRMGDRRYDMAFQVWLQARAQT